MSEILNGKTTMGVNQGGAWVRQGETLYHVRPPLKVGRHRHGEFVADDLTVFRVRGPDVLDEVEVRSCAMTAFLDANGTA